MIRSRYIHPDRGKVLPHHVPTRRLGTDRPAIWMRPTDRLLELLRSPLFNDPAFKEDCDALGLAGRGYLKASGIETP